MHNTSDNYRTEQPLMRIFTLGEFALERLVPVSTQGPDYAPYYARVSRGEWSNRGPAMAMLKVLLCRPNRRASRDELIEAIWPDREAINAPHALDSAASILRRHILQTRDSGSLLLTLRSGGETIFKLSGQRRLWVDADAFLSMVSQAMRAECQGQNPTALLEEAYALASGEFLEEDLYAEWAHGRRQTINGARQRVLFKLVDHSLEDGCVGRAEELLFSALEEDPTDEDALCRLMMVLLEQQRRQEALQLYQYTEDVLREERTEPAVYTRELARRIRQGLVLRERVGGYTTASAAPPASVGTDIQSKRRADTETRCGMTWGRIMIAATKRGGRTASSYRYSASRTWSVCSKTQE
jgi:DNA-binding SARP family transcriptional activator